MSRFYGSLRGRAVTTATRQGTTVAPVRAHVRGWDIGVDSVVRDSGGRDHISAELTGGSNSTPHGSLKFEADRMEDGSTEFAVWIHGEPIRGKFNEKGELVFLSQNMRWIKL